MRQYYNANCKRPRQRNFINLRRAHRVASRLQAIEHRNQVKLSYANPGDVEKTY
jgi:hypothetical protein